MAQEGTSETQLYALRVLQVRFHKCLSHIADLTVDCGSVGCFEIWTLDVVPPTITTAEQHKFPPKKPRSHQPGGLTHAYGPNSVRNVTYIDAVALTCVQ